MTSPSTNPSAPAARPLDEQMALRLLFEGTARETGEAFFQALVQNLAKALGTVGAWVTEYDPERRRLRALAFWLNGQLIPWEADIAGTPCEQVIDGGRLVLYPDRVLELFPSDNDLIGAVSYMGVPLEETDGTIIGHLAVLDPGRPLSTCSTHRRPAATEQEGDPDRRTDGLPGRWPTSRRMPRSRR